MTAASTMTIATELVGIATSDIPGVRDIARRRGDRSTRCFDLCDLRTFQ
jgi:hypothetical protein